MMISKYFKTCRMTVAMIAALLLFANESHAENCTFREVWQSALCELSNRSDAFMQAALRQPTASEAIWAVSYSSYAMLLDWKSDVDDILYAYNVLLAGRGLQQLQKSEIQRLRAIGNDGWTETTTPVSAMAPHFEQVVAQRGARLMSIDTNSDSYGFAVVSPEFYERWVFVRIGENVFFEPISNALTNNRRVNGLPTTPRGAPTPIVR